MPLLLLSPGNYGYLAMWSEAMNSMSDCNCFREKVKLVKMSWEKKSISALILAIKVAFPFWIGLGILMRESWDWECGVEWE